MKKFYLLLLANMLCLSAFSQREDQIDTLWQHQINRVFQHMDLERVPHGMLLDYAMEFTIQNLDLERGDYILNFTTANGKRGQEIIIVE